MGLADLMDTKISTAKSMIMHLGLMSFWDVNNWKQK